MRRCLVAMALTLAGCSSESFEIASDVGPEVVESDTRVEPVDTGVIDNDTAVESDAAPETSADAEAETSAETSVDAGADVVADADAEASVDAPSCDAPVLCFTDRDEDGFAAAGAIGMAACVCPRYFTQKSPAVTIDCNDDDPRVHPGATAYYTEPYCVPGTSCSVKSFDYNCNSVDEKQFGVFTACAAGCVGAGYPAATACGVSATLTTCKVEILCKQVANADWKQGCH